jgi:hypothetical protein
VLGADIAAVGDDGIVPSTGKEFVGEATGEMTGRALGGIGGAGREEAGNFTNPVAIKATADMSTETRGFTAQQINSSGFSV